MVPLALAGLWSIPLAAAESTWWWWVLGGGLAALIIAIVAWIVYQSTLDEDSRGPG